MPGTNLDGVNEELKTLNSVNLQNCLDYLAREKQNKPMICTHIRAKLLLIRTAILEIRKELNPFLK